MRHKSSSSILFWTRFNAAFLLLLGLTEALLGERTSPSALLLYLPQHPFGLLTVALVLASLKRGNRRYLGVNLAVGVAFVIFLLGARVPLHIAPPQGQKVRIMTWNVEKLRGTPEEIAKVIKAQHPDIICMQETLAGRGQERTPDLLRLFPGWEFRRAREVTTLSRFPLLESHNYLMPMPHTRKLLATTWKTPAGPLCVLNTHIATTAAGQNENFRPGLWRRAINVARFARGTALTRLSQLPVIDRALSDCKTPIVLAGDFNNPPRGWFYRHLTGQLRDAFADAGWGLGQSFPSKFPLLRIDYIWLGNGVRATRCINPTSRASDHLPLVADIVYGAS